MSRLLAGVTNYIPLCPKNATGFTDEEKLVKAMDGSLSGGLETIAESISTGHFGSFIENIMAAKRKFSDQQNELNSRQPPAVLLLVSSTFYTALTPWIVTDDDDGIAAEEITFYKNVPTFKYSTSFAINEASIGNGTKESESVVASALEILRPQLRSILINECLLYPWIVTNIEHSPNLDRIVVEAPLTRPHQTALFAGLGYLVDKHRSHRLVASFGDCFRRPIFNNMRNPQYCQAINNTIHSQKLLQKYQDAMMRACHSDFSLLPQFLRGIQAFTKVDSQCARFREVGELQSGSDSSSSSSSSSSDDDHHHHEDDRDRLRGVDVVAKKDAARAARRMRPLEDFTTTLEHIEAIVQNGDFAKMHRIERGPLEIIATLALITENFFFTKGIDRNRQFVRDYGKTLLPQILDVTFKNLTDFDAETDSYGAAFLSCLELYSFLSPDSFWAAAPSYPATPEGVLSMVTSGRRSLEHFPFDKLKAALSKIIDNNITLAADQLLSLGNPLRVLTRYLLGAEFPIEAEAKIRVPLLVETGVLGLFCKVFNRHREIVQGSHLKQLGWLLGLFSARQGAGIRPDNFFGFADEIPEEKSRCPTYDRQVAKHLDESGGVDAIFDFSNYWMAAILKRIEQMTKAKDEFDKEEAEKSKKRREAVQNGGGDRTLLRGGAMPVNIAASIVSQITGEQSRQTVHRQLFEVLHDAYDVGVHLSFILEKLLRMTPKSLRSRAERSAAQSKLEHFVREVLAAKLHDEDESRSDDEVDDYDPFEDYDHDEDEEGGDYYGYDDDYDDYGDDDEYEEDDDSDESDDDDDDDDDDDGDRLVDPFMMLLPPHVRRRRGALPGRLVVGDDDDDEDNYDDDDEGDDDAVVVNIPSARMPSSGTRRTRGGKAVVKPTSTRPAAKKQHRNNNNKSKQKTKTTKSQVQNKNSTRKPKENQQRKKKVAKSSTAAHKKTKVVSTKKNHPAGKKKPAQQSGAKKPKAKPKKK